MKTGTWVAERGDTDSPRIGFVKGSFVDSVLQELLINVALYGYDGTCIGRESPALGGPYSYEPGLPAADWEPIEPPCFPLGPRLTWIDDDQRVRHGIRPYLRRARTNG